MEVKGNWAWLHPARKHVVRAHEYYEPSVWGYGLPVVDASNPFVVCAEALPPEANRSRVGLETSIEGVEDDYAVRYGRVPALVKIQGSGNLADVGYSHVKISGVPLIRRPRMSGAHHWPCWFPRWWARRRA